MLSNGIPRKTEYQRLASQPLYEELLQFSRQFEVRCRDGGMFSKLYGLKWVEDPFLQWSRSWEYVYVLQRLEHWWKSHSGTSDLVDAGSGFTFFPFYLQQLHPIAKIRCFDADITVGKAIARAGRATSTAPDFYLENLEQLKQETESIDVVYSISVIEHTQHPRQVIDEIHRILKPGGLFLCTFDISFEEQSPMHVRHVEKLIARVLELFDQEPGWNDIGVAGASSDPDAVTTRWISEVAPEKLPWKFPTLIWLYDALRGRLRSSLYRPMTFYCGAYYKK